MIREGKMEIKKIRRNFIAVLALVSLGMAVSAFAQMAPAAPNLHAINQELRQQMREINKYMSLKKLDREQAKAAMNVLRMVRQKELEFFRENGKDEITPVQKTQLKNLLDQNSKLFL